MVGEGRKPVQDDSLGVAGSIRPDYVHALGHSQRINADRFNVLPGDLYDEGLSRLPRSSIPTDEQLPSPRQHAGPS